MLCNATDTYTHIAWVVIPMDVEAEAEAGKCKSKRQAVVSDVHLD